MAARTIQVTFDAHSPQDLALFWLEALHYAVFPAPGAELAPLSEALAAWDAFMNETNVPESERDAAFAIVDPDGIGPRIYFQRVPEGKTAKNRVHLDIRVGSDLPAEERMAALEHECERLVALGAQRIERFDPQPPMTPGHIVMTDPEGNEFCLD